MAIVDRRELAAIAEGGVRVDDVLADRGDRIPQVPDAVDGDAESGRGLRIVAAYADRWGVEEAPAHGKTVWAELAPDRGVS